MFDFIIVGQGIAGSMLAWFLHKAGKTLLVIDDDKSITPSRITSGVINPVTGRRLVKTWLADELLPFAAATYHELETPLGEKLYEPLKIVRLFDSVKAQNDWSVRCALKEYSPYLDNGAMIHLADAYINNPFGGFELKEAAHVNGGTFLTAFKAFLQKHQQIYAGRFSYSDLELKEDSVSYKGATARQIIFAEGIQALQNPFFEKLPFYPAKGECLIVEIADFLYDYMVKGEVVLMPFYEKNIYYVGSTHEIDFENSFPSAKGRQELESGLKSFLKCSYKVLDHWAAVRPTVSGRRPLIGIHPRHKRVGIFNGMGTKGISLAPYFANQFVEHLLLGKPLNKEVDIKRFLS